MAARPSGLRTELTKVVVQVQVAPPEPGGVGHAAEYRMKLPVEAPGRRRDQLQQRLELRDVRGEVAGPRASQLLIDLRTGDDYLPALRSFFKNRERRMMIR